ncbi:MAG: SGNH/GDSL hydrolase family protein [Armatimonadia bacterium]
MQRLALLIVSSLILGGLAVAQEAPFVAPPLPQNLDQVGKNIQRTMTLLATSTPEKRNKVRILFYGQSVTAGPWTYALAEDIKKAYPNADLLIENRAIGGYEAPSLIQTADYDLYPFYPDLLIFHVWGGVKTGEQEEIIRRVRQRTTAEIMIWTTHFRWPKDAARDASWDDPAVQAITASDEERVALYRAIAPKYGIEIAEVREALRQYLKDNNLYPKDTLADSVHPNKLGNFLLQSLVRPYLRYDPKFSQDPWKDLVKEIPATDPRVERKANGSLKLTFEGNRIDLIAAHAEGARGTARVLIDGKAPSQFPELYYHCRPTAAPHVWWPAVNKIGFEKAPLLEKWTLKITECDPEKNLLKYTVSGSVTGPDGEGDQSQRFVSNSGRVVIEPGKFGVCGALKYKKLPLPDDYLVTWETRPLFVDTYQAPETPDKSREYPTTLAQGLSNGTHTVEIIPNGDGPVPVAAFRAYRPPLAVDAPK